jgi:hypothetical protein
MVHPDLGAPAAHKGFWSALLLVLRVVALIVLFSAAAVYEASHLGSLNAPEVWIHLRTGTWMLENHAIPRTGLFSQFPTKSWNDSTWGFDLILGGAYRMFGLRAIPLLLMTLKACVAVTTFLLARSGRAGFWQAVVLSAIAQYLIVAVQPLPHVFSILFFAFELRLLLRSRYSGSLRSLYWLPLLFVAWANLHNQFVVGLILLAVFVIALLIELWVKNLQPAWVSQNIMPLPVRQLSAIAAMSLLATFATPYGYRPLLAFFGASYSDVGFQHFAEMSAMTFRRPQDYGLMLLVMMAFLALGRRRSLNLFELLMLLGATAVAFRIQRDGWIVALVAVGVLSTSFFPRPSANQSGRAWGTWDKPAVAGTTAIALMIAAARLPDQNALMNRVRLNFPVKACDYIASSKLAGPLFNEYSFGSFLTWYLPEYPVVVDSRVELYGDRILGEYFDVVGGKERLDSRPMVARAGILLLERNSAMAKALTNLPALRTQYRLVYSDELAALFVPLGNER